MDSSINNMIDKVKKMNWNPSKKMPLEMKKACEVINKKSTFGRGLLTLGVGGGVMKLMQDKGASAAVSALVKSSPETAAKITAKAVETFGKDAPLIFGAGVGFAIVATGVLAMKKVQQHFEKKDKEQEDKIKSENDISEVAFDIFLGKYTPVELNNQYKNKTDDIVKKLSNKDLEPEEALKEIEKLENEYKEKAIPGIEKALTSSGWKKNQKGEYSFEEKDFEEKFNSFFKKANENQSMILEFKNLKNRIKELDVFKKAIQNPSLFSKSIVQVIKENS